MDINKILAESINNEYHGLLNEVASAKPQGNKWPSGNKSDRRSFNEVVSDSGDYFEGDLDETIDKIDAILTEINRATGHRWEVIDEDNAEQLADGETTDLNILARRKFDESDNFDFSSIGQLLKSKFGVELKHVGGEYLGDDEDDETRDREYVALYLEF